jgi:O-antigen ligase
LTALAFLALREPAPALLVLVPFVALANLEAWIERGAAYPAEAILLAAVLVVALRRPDAFCFTGAARIALAYGAWVAIAALAATWTSSDRAAATDLTRLLRTGFLAATMAALGSTVAATARGAARWSLAALGAAGVLGALALGEAGLGRGSGVPTTGSPIGGSELLALHLTLLLPPGLVLIAGGEGPRRAIRAALLLAAGCGLVLSFSRSGWIGAWAAILGMGLVAIKADRALARRLLALALILAVGTALAAILLLAAGGETARAFGDRLGSLRGPALIADRALEWQRGVMAVRAHPWFGHPTAPNPYNLALGLAATSGLPALALFVWFVAACLARGWRAVGRADRESHLAVGLLGAVFALLATGIGESTLGARLSPPVFATLGLLAGMGSPHPARRSS